MWSSNSKIDKVRRTDTTVWNKCDIWQTLGGNLVALGRQAGSIGQAGGAGTVVGEEPPRVNASRKVAQEAKNNLCISLHSRAQLVVPPTIMFNLHHHRCFARTSGWCTVGVRSTSRPPLPPYVYVRAAFLVILRRSPLFTASSLALAAASISFGPSSFVCLVSVSALNHWPCIMHAYLDDRSTAAIISVVCTYMLCSSSRQYVPVHTTIRWCVHLEYEPYIFYENWFGGQWIMKSPLYTMYV